MPTIQYVQDTIAARATAQGKGGIGIIRVSGPLVASVAKQILGQIPIPRYATLCDFIGAEPKNPEAPAAGSDGPMSARAATSFTIDRGIAIYYPAPDSFTGEDVLELQGHGGPVVLDLLLRRVVELGARIAAPGEFSQRAFLNNKLDLAQAEAIADLINSSTEQAARGAMRSLEGRFSALISTLLAEVIELRVLVEAAIDFPDEEIDFPDDVRIGTRLARIESRVAEILRQAGQGAMLAEGLSVVLLGKPNAGKSSLMNSLTGRDTAIVTEIPGTTRDTVEDQIHLAGIPVRLTDTAGIRHSDDRIEVEGVRRAVKAVEAADLMILVLDATLGHRERVIQVEELMKTAGIPGDRMLIALNKIDLVDAAGALEVEPFADAVCLSCKTGAGLTRLKRQLVSRLGYDMNPESDFTARTRHVIALQEAGAALAAAKDVMAGAGGAELLAEELRVCQQALSRITGAFGVDDLLGEIFSSFCIGK